MTWLLACSVPDGEVQGRPELDPRDVHNVEQLGRDDERRVALTALDGPYVVPVDPCS